MVKMDCLSDFVVRSKQHIVRQTRGVLERKFTTHGPLAPFPDITN